LVRKIVEKVPDEVLKADLERYRQYALELGAEDAKIITTDLIAFDPRADARCRYPMCGAYGTNANCPPHSETLEETRQTVQLFRYAVIFTITIPSREVAGLNTGGAHNKYLRKMFEIISKVEAQAFMDGYYFALGYAPGPCKAIFCPDVDCSVLQGKPCRASFQARSEGSGLDMYLTTTRVGWDIYPCGRCVMPEDLPFGRLVSFVLIY
jgi:predicted metal-binding protein